MSLWDRTLSCRAGCLFLTRLGGLVLRGGTGQAREGAGVGQEHEAPPLWLRL